MRYMALTFATIFLLGCGHRGYRTLVGQDEHVALLSGSGVVIYFPDVADGKTWIMVGEHNGEAWVMAQRHSEIIMSWRMKSDGISEFLPTDSEMKQRINELEHRQ